MAVEDQPMVTSRRIISRAMDREVDRDQVDKMEAVAVDRTVARMAMEEEEE